MYSHNGIKYLKYACPTSAMDAEPCDVGSLLELNNIIVREGAALH